MSTLPIQRAALFATEVEDDEDLLPADLVPSESHPTTVYRISMTLGSEEADGVGLVMLVRGTPDGGEPIEEEVDLGTMQPGVPLDVLFLAAQKARHTDDVALSYNLRVGAPCRIAYGAVDEVRGATS